jgi:uncharacterized membrane protein YfcA
MSLFEIIILLITGLLAGLLSGTLGVGGGIIIIPSLVFLLGLSQHQAQGTSLMVFTLPVFLLAAINYARNGQVNYKYAFFLVAAFILGSYIGSTIALKIPSQSLTKIFAVLLIIMGIRMFFSK